MWWDTNNYSFIFKISNRYNSSDLLNGKQRTTKSQVLSFIMTIFDPLGLLGFFVVFAKIILQENWRTGCGWDDVIGYDQYAKSLGWIPRCYVSMHSNDLKEIEIHTIVDASEDAFAAVSYVRCSDGLSVCVSLLGCKTKVEQLKIQYAPLP